MLWSERGGGRIDSKLVLCCWGADEMRGVNGGAILFVGRGLRSVSTAAAGGTLARDYGTQQSSCYNRQRGLVAGSILRWSQEVEERKPKDVAVYQYEACPWANKVSAFLDYYEIPYTGVTVAPITKKEIRWSHNKKLPLFRVDGQLLDDSSDLINKLVTRLHPDYFLTAHDEEMKWRRWVDNYLVHVASANAYRTLPQAIQSFAYAAPEFFFPSVLPFSRRSLFQRACMAAEAFAGAAVMYCLSKKFKRKHGITDEREALHAAAQQWVHALNGRRFLGGQDEPNLADLAVYGALRSITFLQSGADMLENTPIHEWYSDMSEVVGTCYRIWKHRNEFSH